MKWTIQLQEEVYGKIRIPVRCKRLRYYPKKKKGKFTGFGKFRFPLLQVIAENEQGYRIKIKLNAYNGFDHPKFVIKHPDTMAYPTITVGAARNRRKIPDVLSPKVKMPGLKEEYDAVDFEKRLQQLVGVIKADEIMTLFANKIGAVASKKAA